MASAHEPAPGTVLVEEEGGPLAQRVRAGPHVLVAGEPAANGGDDSGPSPRELLLAALGACTSMTLRLYAKHKGLPLERVSVRLRHTKVPAEGGSGPVERIDREITLVGDLTPDQRRRMLEIAERCPIHRTLVGEKRIVTTLA
jgi:putative redox protein